MVKKVKVANRQFPRRLQLVPPLSPKRTHMMESWIGQSKPKKTHSALLPLLHDHFCRRLAHHVHHIEGTFDLCCILKISNHSKHLVCYDTSSKSSSCLNFLGPGTSKSNKEIWGLCDAPTINMCETMKSSENLYYTARQWIWMKGRLDIGWIL